MNKFNKLSLALSALVFSGAAMATPAGPDVSDVQSAIEAAATPIAAIGAAVLVLLVGVKVYKWIRRAL